MQRQRISKLRSQSGFTLIELVSVIVLLGVLAVSALPRFVGLQGDARVAVLTSVAGTLSSASYQIYLKQLIEGDTGNDATAGINLFGEFVQTSYGYPDGSAGDMLSLLQIEAALKAAPFSGECVEDSFCLNSRLASSSYPGLTLPSTDGRVAIVFPSGYSRNDRCFAYYWFSQLANASPEVGVVSEGCA